MSACSSAWLWIQNCSFDAFFSKNTFGRQVLVFAKRSRLVLYRCLICTCMARLMEFKRVSNKRIVEEDEEMPELPRISMLRFPIKAITAAAAQARAAAADAAPERPPLAAVDGNAPARLSMLNFPIKAIAAAHAAASKPRAAEQPQKARESLLALQPARRQYVKVKRATPAKDKRVAVKPGKLTTVEIIRGAYKKLLDCCNKAGELSLQAVTGARVAVWERDQTGRSQWLLDSIRTCMTKKAGAVSINLSLDGIALCMGAFPCTARDLSPVNASLCGSFLR